jgi:RND family efflux transporter MFP subunit
MRIHATLLGLTLLACEPEPAAPRPAPTIAPELEPVIASPPRLAEPAMIGVLVPRAEVVLVASGFARLERLDLEVGDHVGEGELIAELDVRGTRNSLALAKAAWKAAAADLEQLELELEQARAKREDVEQLEDYVSKAELREQRHAEKLADARKRSAGASLSQQRSRMEEASARIAEAELRAPFAGSIADRWVDAGATLETGDAIVRLISDARVVRFAVPEARSAALRLGAEVKVAFPELGEIAGRVVTIAPEIQVGTRLIFAEAELAGSTDLRVGTVGRVRFVNLRPSGYAFRRWTPSGFN